MYTTKIETPFVKRKSFLDPLAIKYWLEAEEVTSQRIVLVSQVDREILSLILGIMVTSLFSLIATILYLDVDRVFLILVVVNIVFIFLVFFKRINTKAKAIKYVFDRLDGCFYIVFGIKIRLNFLFRDATIKKTVSKEAMFNGPKKYCLSLLVFDQNLRKEFILLESHAEDFVVKAREILISYMNFDIKLSS